MRPMNNITYIIQYKIQITTGIASISECFILSNLFSVECKRKLFFLYSFLFCFILTYFSCTPKISWNRVGESFYCLRRIAHKISLQKCLCTENKCFMNHWHYQLQHSNDEDAVRHIEIKIVGNDNDIDD